jgi:ABC-type branched-subunit amino acid transport system ATPase component
VRCEAIGTSLRILRQSCFRLELAIVLATNPKLLLVDEAAAGLTEGELPQIFKLLNDVRHMGITVLLIEHVMKVKPRIIRGAYSWNKTWTFQVVKNGEIVVEKVEKA